MDEARRRTGDLRRLIADSEVVLYAGRRVAAAFDIHPHHEGLDYFEGVAYLDKPTYMVPHPSGVNRWWNERTNRERACDFLVELAVQ